MTARSLACLLPLLVGLAAAAIAEESAYFEIQVIFAEDILNPTPSPEGLPRSRATNSPIPRTSVLTFHLR